MLLVPLWCFFFCLFFFLKMVDAGLKRLCSENYFFTFTGGEVFFHFILEISILFTFLVKFPIYGLHVWLPKAHVEAPTLGSIILAGILLKLGGIGFILFQKLLLRTRSFILLLRLFRLWGAVWRGLSCLKQEDTKVLIAFSRVNHIALVIFGFLNPATFSILGGRLLIAGHGLISSLIFYINGMVYSLISTRNLFFIKSNSFHICLIWFFVCFTNAGLPPFVNFFGEMFIVINIIFIKTLLPIFFLNFFVVILYSCFLLIAFWKKKTLFRQKFFEGGLFFDLIIIYIHLVPVIFILSLVFFIF